MTKNTPVNDAQSTGAPNNDARQAKTQPSDPNSATDQRRRNTPRISPARQARVASALKRYSVAAYVTGVWLLILCVEMVFDHLILDNPPDWFMYIGMAHGFFFMVYLIMTLDLGTKARWKPVKWLTTCLAGTIPFLSFVVEARRRHEVQKTFNLS
mgnify:FL=1